MTRRRPPLARVQASGEGETEALARLQAQQASLDPFELNRRIEEKLGTIYELARRRVESVSGFASQPAPNRPRSLNDTVTHVASGYILDGLTARLKVTFLKWLDAGGKTGSVLGYALLGNLDRGGEVAGKRANRASALGLGG